MIRLLRAICVLPILALTCPTPAQEIQISKDNKTVAITTGGEASALADTAAVSIGFQTYGKDKDAAYTEASRLSNAIVTALTADNVPKGAIESTNQQLEPLSPNSDENKLRYAEGIRFQFSQGWRVTVTAGQAATVLQVAITAGANQSGNIQWSVHDENALEAEAARDALKHAREIATTMAEGLGAKLGGLLYASNQTPNRIPFTKLGIGVGGSMGGGVSRTALAAAPLAISPERITKSATVYAAFAIQ